MLLFLLKSYPQTEHLFSLCLSANTIMIQWEEPVGASRLFLEEPSQRTPQHSAFKTKITLCPPSSPPETCHCCSSLFFSPLFFEVSNLANVTMTTAPPPFWICPGFYPLCSSFHCSASEVSLWCPVTIPTASVEALTSYLDSAVTSFLLQALLKPVSQDC